MTTSNDQLHGQAWRLTRALTRQQRLAIVRQAGWTRIPRQQSELWKSRDGRRCSLSLATALTLAQQLEREAAAVDEIPRGIFRRLADCFALLATSSRRWFRRWWSR